MAGDVGASRAPSPPRWHPRRAEPATSKTPRTGTLLLDRRPRVEKPRPPAGCAAATAERGPGARRAACPDRLPGPTEEEGCRAVRGPSEARARAAVPRPAARHRRRRWGAASWSRGGHGRAGAPTEAGPCPRPGRPVREPGTAGLERDRPGTRGAAKDNWQGAWTPSTSPRSADAAARAGPRPRSAGRGARTPSTRSTQPARPLPSPPPVPAHGEGDGQRARTPSTRAARRRRGRSRPRRPSRHTQSDGQ